MKRSSLVVAIVLLTAFAASAQEAIETEFGLIDDRSRPAANRPTTAPATRPVASAAEDGITVYFSPHGGCTEAVVAAIDATQTTLDVQAYSFTSTPIAHAIRVAHDRGVKIRVVLDKSQRTERYSSATYLFNAGVPVWIDAKHAIAHNKVMILDGKTIITGSFNFTNAAEKSNAENLLVIEGKPQLVDAYEKNFEAHLRHSQKYTGLAAAPPSTRPADADGP